MFCTWALFITSCGMNVMPHLQDAYKMYWLEYLKQGGFIVILLVLLLEAVIFAAYSLPIALNGAMIRSIFERKKQEDEAVIGFIYEMRSQRLKEGKIDIAKHTILQRMADMFLRTKTEIK